jgi:hypothetical protein
MSARERREHLERAVADGGMIMTARGTLTREVPSSSTLARTPEEKRAAHEDLERRRLALDQEERRLKEDGEGQNEGSDWGKVSDDTNKDADKEPANAGGQGAGNAGGGQGGGGQTGTPLPAKFTGRIPLTKAGYTTLEAVRTLSKEELDALEGITLAMADRIIEERM